VSINGRGPFLFVLNTGASHSVISRALANVLGLTPIARTSVLTSTGPDERPVVRLELTTLGTKRSEGLLVSVADATRLARISRGIDGVIGQDFLSALNYTLDYRRRRLTWNDNGATDADIRLPLVRQRGRYLVQVASTARRPPVLLVPDTGTNGMVMFERDGRTALPLDEAPGSIAVRSLSGMQQARSMLLRELKLGGAIIYNQPVAVFRRGEADAGEGDGLLPLHLFDSVSFNARERYLTIRTHR